MGWRQIATVRAKLSVVNPARAFGDLPRDAKHEIFGCPIVRARLPTPLLGRFVSELLGRCSVTLFQSFWGPRADRESTILAFWPSGRQTSTISGPPPDPPPGTAWMRQTTLTIVRPEGPASFGSASGLLTSTGGRLGGHYSL